MEIRQIIYQLLKKKSYNILRKQKGEIKMKKWLKWLENENLECSVREFDYLKITDYTFNSEKYGRVDVTLRKGKKGGIITTFKGENFGSTEYKNIETMIKNLESLLK